MVQCPNCSSDNITNLSIDSNDFICNDCGEQFEADNGIDTEENEEMESNDASFVDLDPATAMNLAKQVRNENTKSTEEE